MVKAGPLGRGAVVGIVGLLFVYAAFDTNPERAGGVGAAFSWLSEQAYGQILVTLVCIGFSVLRSSAS